MLKGIDVSSWQGDIQVQNMPVEFVIAKATQGTDYVNPYCDPVIQRCISSGKLWGFYHFSDDRCGASESAQYFIDNCYSYFTNGIPVLDWEELYDKNGNKVSDPSVQWVNEFVRYVKDKTGVWPWVYGNPWRFNQGGVEPNCGRWVADYPDVLRPSLDYDPGEPPATDGLVCCWQYASDGVVSGYSGNLDVNHFFGDAKAWGLYAGFSTNNPPSVENPDSSILENDEYRVEITKK